MNVKIEVFIVFLVILFGLSLILKQGPSKLTGATTFSTQALNGTRDFIIGFETNGSSAFIIRRVTFSFDNNRTTANQTLPWPNLTFQGTPVVAGDTVFIVARNDTSGHYLLAAINLSSNNTRLFSTNMTFGFQVAAELNGSNFTIAVELVGGGNIPQIAIFNMTGNTIVHSINTSNLTSRQSTIARIRAYRINGTLFFYALSTFGNNVNVLTQINGSNGQIIKSVNITPNLPNASQGAVDFTMVNNTIIVLTAGHVFSVSTELNVLNILTLSDEFATQGNEPLRTFGSATGISSNTDRTFRASVDPPPLMFDDRDILFATIQGGNPNEAMVQMTYTGTMFTFPHVGGTYGTEGFSTSNVQQDGRDTFGFLFNVGGGNDRIDIVTRSDSSEGGPFTIFNFDSGQGQSAYWHIVLPSFITASSGGGGASCGNAILETGEDCEPPSTSPASDCYDASTMRPKSGKAGGTCDASCNCVAECGNTVIETGETCDGTSKPAGCTASTCRPAGSPGACTCCGDGVVQTTSEVEECEVDSQCRGSITRSQSSLDRALEEKNPLALIGRALMGDPLSDTPETNTFPPLCIKPDCKCATLSPKT